MTDIEESMVEWCAKAIDPSAWNDGAWMGYEWADQAAAQQSARIKARAAIAAMREPTEDMLLAAAVEDEVAAEDGNVVAAYWHWRAMIDAALGDQS